MIALSGCAAALLGGAPAAATHTAPLTQLDATAKASKHEWHDFEITATNGATIVWQVFYDGELVETETGTADDIHYVPPTYYWSCELLGEHTWTVTASDDRDNQLTRSGTFTVPGRCYRRNAPVPRRRIVRYIEGDNFKPNEFIAYIDCDARSRLSWKWRCVVVWQNGRRECGARFVFRSREQIEFSRVARDWLTFKRTSRRVCAQFYAP